MIDPTDVPTRSRTTCPPTSPRQRWSGAGERHITERRPPCGRRSLAAEGDPTLLWMLVGARFADGGAQHYQLFFGVRSPSRSPTSWTARTGSGRPVLVDDRRGHGLRHARSIPTSPSPCCTSSPPTPKSSCGDHRARALELLGGLRRGDDHEGLPQGGGRPQPRRRDHTRAGRAGYAHVLPPLAELRRDGIDLAVLRAFLVGCHRGLGPGPHLGPRRARLRLARGEGRRLRS